MKRISFLFIIFGILFLVGCGNNGNTNNQPKTNSQNVSTPSNKGEVDYDNLREKAKVSEAASLVGYDGKAIKNNLNKIIDENEKMNKEYKDLDL